MIFKVKRIITSAQITDLVKNRRAGCSEENVSLVLLKNLKCLLVDVDNNSVKPIIAYFTKGFSSESVCCSNNTEAG